MTQTIDAARLSLLLNDLRLPAIRQGWAMMAERADREAWPAARFLASLAEHEIAERDRRRIERHLLEARLLPGKTLDSFDFTAVPALSHAHVAAICAGDSWIEAGANLILLGGPGGGKTHLASAIGLALVENGWRVLFARTSDLVQKLQVARRELALEAAIVRLDRYHLLILDDLAYVTKDQAETSVLFELISARYERRSMLITANTGFGEWGRIFPDLAMTLAAVDRIVHHATIFEINVEQLPQTRSPGPQAERRRQAADARDNQNHRRCVAARQSNHNISLASDNQQEHHRTVAITFSPPDRRALSPRLLRNTPSSSRVAVSSKPRSLLIRGQQFSRRATKWPDRILLRIVWESRSRTTPQSERNRVHDDLAPLARQFGLTRIGIHQKRLPPGRRTSYRHAESAEEEFVFVLEGLRDVWIVGDLHGLAPVGSSDTDGYLPLLPQ